MQSCCCDNYSGTSLIQTPMGQKKVSIIVSEVSLFQGLNCMQELFLGKEKVSLLERCPHFRGVLREIRAHYNCAVLHNVLLLLLAL